MTRIFVEGRDADFIDKYLVHLYGENKGRWEIVSTGGYTKLALADQQFKENSDGGGSNLIIFDADFTGNNGGFSTRKTYIEGKLDELSISSGIFLFPNNHDDGDFELLLENIINEEHRCLLECFEGYEKCVGGHLDGNGNPKYLTPNRKAKMYAYVESFKKSRSDRERFKNRKDFFFDNPEYWNLDAGYLSPLKEFLQKAIKQEE